MKNESYPLVILGFDAAEPSLLMQWAEEGYLPTFASILKKGWWGRTIGPEMISEPGIWLSLFSGVSRSEHGHYYYRQLKPGTYDLARVHGRDFNAPPFWESFRSTGKKVAIIDIPDQVALSGLEGVQLFDWAGHNPGHKPHTEPKNLLPEIQKIFGANIEIEEKFNSNYDEDKNIFHDLMERVEKKGELCRYLLSKDQFDLAVIVFTESHIATHTLWKYQSRIPGREGEKNNTELAHGIREVYQAIDYQMGLLLTQLQREANIVILSSVGVQDHYPDTGLIEQFCQTMGYQTLSRPKAFSAKPIDLFRQLIPESWRLKLSRYLPKHAQEGLLADQFLRYTDWKRTKAFAVPSDYPSFIRVNLRDREPEGIVEKGTEYETLLDQIESDLKQLFDSETGRPIVAHIARATQLYGGNPPDSLPDLFIEWKLGPAFVKTIKHPNGACLQPPSKFWLGSSHTYSGLVAAAGPSIKGQGFMGDFSLLDLAPTFLSLMNESVPSGLKGRAIQAMVESL